jgi:hypothetical protein
MTKHRPPVAKHTNRTGISSPSLPAADRGKRWPAANTGSGARPVPSKAPIETSAPASQNRDYLPDRHSVKPKRGR